MTHWYIVSRVDARARFLADGHYNRQHIGALHFVGPGNAIVLIIPNGTGGASAVWASNRRVIGAGYEIREDGFNYWNNSLFRNELPKTSNIKASDLIREAVAITIGIWGKPFSPDGFHTFVDPKYVKPTMVRGEEMYGFSYWKAGFDLHPERTKINKLWRWILSTEKMDEIQPIEPNYEQLRLFD